MATNKTITNSLPPGTDQLDDVKQVTRAMEDYSYQVMGCADREQSRRAWLEQRQIAKGSLLRLAPFTGASAGPADLPLPSVGQFPLPRDQ